MKLLSQFIQGDMAYYLPSEKYCTFPRGDNMPHHPEQNVIIIYHHMTIFISRILVLYVS